MPARQNERTRMISTRTEDPASRITQVGSMNSTIGQRPQQKQQHRCATRPARQAPMCRRPEVLRGCGGVLQVVVVVVVVVATHWLLVRCITVIVLCIGDYDDRCLLGRYSHSHAPCC